MTIVIDLFTKVCDFQYKFILYSCNIQTKYTDGMGRSR